MKNDLRQTKLSDSAFMKQFENCTLDPTTFNHEAHLRLAWIHISMFGAEQAKKNIQRQLQNFVEYVGAKDKYHHTLTVVAIETVNHFMKKSKSNSFQNFVIEFPQLKSNFKGLINSHYSFDVFQSIKAKNGYIEPDVVPFE